MKNKTGFSGSFKEKEVGPQKPFSADQTSQMEGGKIRGLFWVLPTGAWKRKKGVGQSPKGILTILRQFHENHRGIVVNGRKDGTG